MQYPYYLASPPPRGEDNIETQVMFFATMPSNYTPPPAPAIWGDDNRAPSRRDGWIAGHSARRRPLVPPAAVPPALVPAAAAAAVVTPAASTPPRATANHMRYCGSPSVMELCSEARDRSRSPARHRGRSKHRHKCNCYIVTHVVMQ